MTMLTQLTVAYSSLAERVPNIRAPRGVGEILVCVQGGDGQVPAGARAVVVPGIGVARSRNAAIDETKTRYLLFCDDDVEVDVAGVRGGVEHLIRTGAALALGTATDPQGRARKQHPGQVRPLRRRSAGRAATYEMLVDVHQVRAAGVRFDEAFGAGAPLHLGDEFIFIADLLRAGLAGDAVPFVFGVHPAESSGERWGTRRDARARAAAINRAYGWLAPLARVGFAWRHRARLGGWGAMARFAVDGTRPVSAGIWPRRARRSYRTPTPREGG